MSEFAEKVRHYYIYGMWSLARVRKAREIGKITETEYKSIIGE